MARERDYDEDDDDRGRRPRRDRDDDYDDDDDRRRPVRRQLTGLEKMYADTSVPVLVLFGLCCGLIALIMSAVALGTSTDETAKKNAMLTLIISIVMTMVGAIAQVIRLMADQRF